MVYVDSNILLYPLLYDPKAVEEAGEAKAFLLKVARGEVEAYTSTLTWDEVVWVVRRLVGAAPSIEAGRKLLRLRIGLLGVRASTIHRAQILMERYELRPRDAIHAATAIENDVSSFVSFDEGFDVVDELDRVRPSLLL